MSFSIRVTTETVDKFEEEFIDSMVTRFESDSPTMVADLYVLCRSTGSAIIMSRSDCQKIIRKDLQTAQSSGADFDFVGVSRATALARKVLGRLQCTNYFQYLVKHYQAEKATERILSFIRSMKPKTKEQDALPDESITQEDFDEVSKVLTAIEDEILQMAVSSCNEGQGTDVMSIVEAIAAGCRLSGKEDKFSATFAGQAKDRLDAFETMILGLSDREMQTLQLAYNLDDAMDTEEGEILVNSNVPDNEQEYRASRGVEDSLNVVVSDQAKHTDESFALAVASGNTTVIQNQEPSAQKQLAYFLIDASGSMTDRIGLNRYGLVTAGDMSAAITLAYIHRAKKRGELFYLRFFTGAPDKLEIAEVGDDFTHVARMVSLCGYNGGGTNIPRAIKQAIDDIEDGNSHKNIRKADIILITDCQDSVDSTKLQTEMDRIPDSSLHVLQVSDKSNYGTYGAPDLKLVAKKFMEVDPDCQDITTMIVDTVEVEV